MASTHPDELPIPPSALEAEDAGEVLRAWIVDGGLAVSLVRAFDEPDMWGMLLVDVARHAARIFAEEGAGTEAEALERIKALFDAEILNPIDPGTTVSHKPQGH